MNTAVAPQPAASLMTATPMEMLASAVERGMAPDVIERLIGFAERIQRTNARMAFDKAMAAAMAKIPVVKKNREGHGGRRYADIAAIASTVNPILAEYGLSYRFHSSRDENYILMTCILAHEAGHYEENTLPAPIDNSGSKNPVQAIGSTTTYLRRYTLVQALGIAIGDDDDDGQAATPETQGDYLARWTALIRDATDDVELKTQWQNEADLRLQVFTKKDNDTVKRLVDKVIERCKELKAAQEQHEASLTTKRLEAEDQ